MRWHSFMHERLPVIIGQRRLIIGCVAHSASMPDMHRAAATLPSALHSTTAAAAVTLSTANRLLL